MISYLKGQVKFKKVIPKKESVLVVDVSGVGYRVGTLERIANSFTLGDDAELFIYTQVAESVLALYGFVDEEELELFEALISISGIGPKSGLDILNKSKVNDLTQAAQTGNYELLSSVSGMSPKKAEKIVAGLKGKVNGATTEHDNYGVDFSEALEALTTLGYSAYQAREALSHSQATDTGERIKEALKILGKK